MTEFIKTFFTKGVTVFTDLGVSEWLAWTYLVISILVIIMAVVALVMWIFVAIRYYGSNRKTLKSGQNSFQIGRQMLDKAGLYDVQIKKAGFLRAWVYGNYYDMKKKTVFIRKRIADKNSITSVGLVLQKVGVAKLCESGDTKSVVRYKMKKLGIFGPLLFIPFILIGAILDIIIFQKTGAFSTVSLVISLVLLAAGFIETMLNIPVEKKANKMALEMIDETGVMTEDERKQIKKVFDTYIVAYVCDFIVTVLRIIQLILEIAMNSQISSNK